MKATSQKEWHALVCERDWYRCQKCKKSFNYPCYFDDKGINQYVCGHHIKTKGSRPDLKLEVDNGVTICDACHKLEHYCKLTQRY